MPMKLGFLPPPFRGEASTGEAFNEAMHLVVHLGAVHLVHLAGGPWGLGTGAWAAGKGKAPLVRRGLGGMRGKG